MKFGLLTGMAFVVLALAGTKVAQASTLIGGESGGSGIYNIDTSDGSHSTIGAATHHVRGLAYDGSTSTMYALSTNTLHSMDISNGSTSVIGTGGTSLTGLTFSADFSILYSISTAGELYSIDKSTGASSLIGGFVNTDYFGGIIDLATNSLGQVFGMGLDGDLYQINTTTGEATFVASSGVNLGFTSISFDENDVLYGVSTCCDGTVPDDSLLTIDVVTGAVSLIGGDIGSDVRALAFAIDSSPAAVPLPGGLPMMGAAFGLLGVIRLRKKRAA